jgi:outer membrane receptor protein involved in Fe transport
LREFATPGFTTWDLRVICQPDSWKNLTVYTGVENLTGKTYREHLDFQSSSGVNVFQPGANYYFGAELSY